MRPAFNVFRSPAARRILPLFLLFATAFAPFCAGGSGELGRPVFRTFPPGSSRIGFICQAVTQDPSGYIYIANHTAARVFDGSNWSRLPLPADCAGIRAFAVAPDGTVFAAGAGIIGYFQGHGPTATFVSLADRLPASRLGCDDLFAVCVVGDSVCFADEEKILVWRDGHFSQIDCPSPRYTQGARFHPIGDKLYVTAPGRPLCRLDLVDNQLDPVADDPLFRDQRILLLELNPTGGFVALTDSHGFFTFDGTHATPLAIEANHWLEGRTILRAARSHDGSLAVAFTAPGGDGGMCFDPAGHYLGPLDQSIGFYTPAIRSIFPDHEGGLWLGLEVGLIRVEWPSAITTFDSVNGLGGGETADIVRHQSTLFAATSEGVFRLSPGDATGRIAHFDRLFDSPTIALVSHPAGLLALTAQSVLLGDNSAFRVIAPLPAHGRALLRSTADPNRFWIGTAHGLHALTFGGGTWQLAPALPGFDQNIRQLVQADDGTLWIATESAGLFRLVSSAARPRPPEPIGPDFGLPARLTAPELVLRGGQPLLTAREIAAPLAFNPATQHFSPIAGASTLPAGFLAHDWVAIGATASAADPLWLASADGIVRLRPNQPAVDRLPHLVSAVVGQIKKIHTETTDGREILWLCGSHSLVRIETARAFPPPTPFPTLLDSAEVSAGQELPPEPPALHFDYLALRHQAADSVVYRTRLIGRNPRWSDWSPDHESTFDRLPAGRYRFDAQARDADGVLSSVASIAFSIRSPWWLTGWALLGYGAGAFALISAIVRLRTRTLQNRARQLEQIVSDRTRELAEKNAELTRLHRLELDEKISARLGEEKARLEILRYQLNPHFLFNALATISGLALREPAAARAVTRQLAEFCRLTLTRGRNEFVTLEEEFAMLETYLDVFRAGSGRPPEIAFTLAPEAQASRIPAFLLLPLVENACKYGRPAPDGPLRIRLTADFDPATGMLAIEVANTGVWLDDLADHGDRPSGRIGLENIRRRLAGTYPGAHAFSTDSADGWVRIRIRLKASPFAT